MARFLARIPLPNNTSLSIKTNIVPINVPLLIRLDIFMEYGIIMDFEQHQFTCKKENWIIRLK